MPFSNGKGICDVKIRVCDIIGVFGILRCIDSKFQEENDNSEKIYLDEVYPFEPQSGTMIKKSLPFFFRFSKCDCVTPLTLFSL